jgi:hypothetical protein
MTAQIRAALNAHPALALAVFASLKDQSPTGRTPTLTEWYLRFESVRTGRLLWPTVPRTGSPEYQHIPLGKKDAWGFCTT